MPTTKRVIATMVNNPKTIYTYKSLAEKMGSSEPTVRQAIHRIPDTLLKTYKVEGRRSGISLNNDNVELAHKYLDGTYPPKKKVLEVGTGTLRYDMHAIQFSMPILHVEDKGRVRYHQDRTMNGTRFRYAKVKTPWLVDYPNLEITICNVNSKTLRVWIPRIRFRLTDPKQAKEHDTLVKELIAKLRRYIQYLGFAVGEVDIPHPHYAIPMEEYAGLLKGRALKVSDVEWLDYTPEEFDTEGRPIPIRETPDKELRDTWLDQEKKKVDQSDKLDWLIEWLTVSEPLNMKERQELKNHMGEIKEVLTQGTMTLEQVMNVLLVLVKKDQYDPLEDLRVMSSTDVDDYDENAEVKT